VNSPAEVIGVTFLLEIGGSALGEGRQRHLFQRDWLGRIAVAPPHHDIEEGRIDVEVGEVARAPQQRAVQRVLGAAVTSTGCAPTISFTLASGRLPGPGWDLCPPTPSRMENAPSPTNAICLTYACRPPVDFLRTMPNFATRDNAGRTTSIAGGERRRQ
jgi:hypothetical protein